MNQPVKKLLWIGGLTAAAATALVLFFFDPAQVHIYPVCSFHRLTGLDCPGCGSLRALHQLFHGHVGTALQLNALTVLSVPLLGGLGAWFLWTKIKNRPAPAVRPLWLWAYLSAGV